MIVWTKNRKTGVGDADASCYNRHSKSDEGAGVDAGSSLILPGTFLDFGFGAI